MHWQALFLYGLAPGLTLAAPNSPYIASHPFHPGNATGLSNLYAWVGSYYNATTTLEFTPFIGHKAHEAVCANVRGQIFTAEFESFLAVTERGSYNAGHSPVNMLLTLWKPGTNLSAFANTETYQNLWAQPSLEWYLESSPWVLPGPANGTFNDQSENPPLPDIFNLTLSQASKAPYNLTGSIVGMDTAVNQFNIDLAACNPQNETRKSLITLIDGPWSDTGGWNWTYPVVNLQFDSKTANFSLDGYFTANQYLRPNASSNPRLPEIGPVAFQGSVKIRFHGIVDRYHSDVLVNNSATPVWLRTVGYGNNSANIGYESAAEGGPRLWGWSVALVSAVVLILST